MIKKRPVVFNCFDFLTSKSILFLGILAEIVLVKEQLESNLWWQHNIIGYYYDIFPLMMYKVILIFIKITQQVQI